MVTPVSLRIMTTGLTLGSFILHLQDKSQLFDGSQVNSIATLGQGKKNF